MLVQVRAWTRAHAESIIPVLLVLTLTSGATALTMIVRGGESHTPASSSADIIAAVGRLILLPSDEQPTVATVANLDALKDQPLFRNAKIGDKVLLYSRTHKAVLYDPVADRVIDVASFGAATSPSF